MNNVSFYGLFYFYKASSGIEQDRNPSTQLTDENQDHVTHANTSVVDLEAINYTGILPYMNYVSSFI